MHTQELYPIQELYHIQELYPIQELCPIQELYPIQDLCPIQELCPINLPYTLIIKRENEDAYTRITLLHMSTSVRYSVMALRPPGWAAGGLRYAL